MKLSALRILRLFALSSACILVAQAQSSGDAQSPFALRSPAFADGTSIPDRYTAAVKDSVSPEMIWENVPSSTAAFVLFLIDKGVDARNANPGFTHWIAYDIPKAARGLPEAVAHEARLADGTTQWKNKKGLFGYHNPGAPMGPDHHYVFELYALDQKLGLGPDATREQIESAMRGHILGKATLVGLFHKRTE